MTVKKGISNDFNRKYNNKYNIMFISSLKVVIKTKILWRIAKKDVKDREKEKKGELDRTKLRIP